ncbi:MAG: SpoIID/LytB domain-containing protein [Agathobacter sp.]|nr:SpoIID/LytB domain-containing protein [Agathobacter sp.]
MKRKEWMRWLGTIALTVCAISVMAYAILAARRARIVSREGDTQAAEHKVQEGRILNAYIEGSKEGMLTVWYEGGSHEYEARLASPYTGIADLEIRDGVIVQVDAKTASIEGTLDSYTDNTVQISGYEKLSYTGEMPVYVLTEGTVRQKLLSDLVIGTSQMTLVVAYGEACALLQYREDVYETIRVLIKNGENKAYKSLYLTGESDYLAGEQEKKAHKVTSAEKLMQERAVGDEVRFTSQEGLLYLCDKNGAVKGTGYEGDFLVRKEEEGYVLINEVPIETYLRYVVPSEMPTYFSYEALKAQAVCARTFAYRQMRSHTYAAYGANLDDSTAFQVYHAAGPYEVTDRAVRDTEGLVLTYEGELIDCYYYSTGSGYSENLEVWNADSPVYLVAENHTAGETQDLSDAKRFHAFISEKPDGFDADSPYYRWTAELSAKMGMDEQYGRLKRVRIDERSASGYILSFTAEFEGGERTYDRENDIRFALSKYLLNVTLADGKVLSRPSALPSACFEVESQKDGRILLRGGGFGHGIGMSQYGADGMAKAGKSWQEILTFYYKGAEIVER